MRTLLWEHARPFSPLPTFGACVRQRQTLTGKRRAWLDRWPVEQGRALRRSNPWHPINPRDAAWSVTGHPVGIPTDSPGVVLLLPATGCADDGHIDWSVVRNNVVRAAGSAVLATVWPWLSDQVHQWWKQSDWPDCFWHPHVGAQQALMAGEGAVAVLGVEDRQGALWRLVGPERLLLTLWHRLTPPPQDLPARGLSGLSSQMWLTVAGPRLARSDFERLVPGSLLLLNTEGDCRVSRLQARLSSLAPGGSCTLGGSALQCAGWVTIGLCAGPVNDAIELRWRGFMKPEENVWSMTGSSDSHEDVTAGLAAHDAIAVQVSCVLASGRFTLSQLLALKPDDLLPMTELPLPQLKLMVDGQIVGSGELVRCGDSLAVQVSNWSMPMGEI